MWFGSMRRRRRLILLVLATTLAGTLAYAGAMISAQYLLSLHAATTGTANTVSPNYKIQTGTLGQGLYGKAQSTSYANSAGFASQAQAMANPAAANLGDAYVYPNPFKPNSPGSFQADKLTFKHLPAQATIKVYAVTGKLMTELHKTDSTVDYYEWNATNSDGQKLASGMYIFFMTSPGGGKAKGKFAVIR